MPKALIVSLFAALAIAILAAALSKALTPAKRNKEHQYTRRKPLTAVEQVLYWRLVQALPDHVVLAQVGLSRCIKTDTQAAFGKISQKSLDYVICDKSGDIITAIELDDSSHNRPSRRRADEVKDNALASAGIPLIRWRTTSLPTTEDIQSAISQATGAVATQHTPSA
jgi:very-short-patch-repair endonuclease